MGKKQSWQQEIFVIYCPTGLVIDVGLKRFILQIFGLYYNILASYIMISWSYTTPFMFLNPA